MQNWQADLLAEQRRYRVLLNEHQLRRVQFASSNILLEAFAAGTLCTMNDEVLRRRAEPTSGGRPTPLTLHKHALSSHRLDIFVYGLLQSRLNEAAASTVVRYVILGVALEPIRRYLDT
ncbi:hypothetical protein EYR40_002330 [Pleurotus pulmonarius]|nr:hypothetical protein EYR40_002330 [Pleurotus pulmonarius]